MAIGPELITNGNFDGNANGWDLLNCSYNNHNISFIDGAGIVGASLSQSNIGLVENNYYFIIVNLTGVAGRMQIGLGSTTNNPNTIVKYQCNSTREIKTIIYQPPGGDDIVILEADGPQIPFDGVFVESVSVRQVTLDDLELGNELISNGSFNGSAAGWDLTNTTWAYGSNNIVHSPGLGGNFANPALFPLTIPDDESMYIFQADIFGTPGLGNDTVEFEIGDGFGVQPGNDNVTTVGTNLRATVQALFGTLYIPYFRWFPNDMFDGTMTNVSVKKILGLINPNARIQNIFLAASDLSGDVQLINAGSNDDSTPIHYELETQDIEFGNKFHKKSLDNKIAVFSKNAVDSRLQIKVDNKDYSNLPVKLEDRVNISNSIGFQGNKFNFKWLGNTENVSPVFEGIKVENIDDLGIVK